LPCEGKSLTPILEEGSGEGDEKLYWYDPHIGAGAVRNENWKLVSEGVNMPWELYDMQADRTETRDLSRDCPQQVKAMKDDWFAWATKMEFDDTLPPR
jgi:arylsulfatase